MKIGEQDKTAKRVIHKRSHHKILQKIIYISGKKINTE